MLIARPKAVSVHLRRDAGLSPLVGLEGDAKNGLRSQTQRAFKEFIPAEVRTGAQSEKTSSSYPRRVLIRPAPKSLALLPELLRNPCSFEPFVALLNRGQALFEGDEWSNVACVHKYF